MKIGLYPGSFDPITFGHIDIIKRALNLFDELIILVADNPNKSNFLLSADERVELITLMFRDNEKIKVVKYDGLTVNACKEFHAHTIVRGLRMLTDFEYEFSMALTNRKIMPDVDSIFLMTSVEFAYLSSSMVKEIAALGGDISQFVPKAVLESVIKACRK